MNMAKMTLELSIKVNHCEDALRALRVDEVNLPRGIRTSISCLGDELKYVVEADVDNPRVILTAWNTVDDFLRGLRALLGVDKVHGD